MKWAGSLLICGSIWTGRDSDQKKRKGRYSKAIVAACILLAVGYTAACLWMQWEKGISPEPQLTIAFYSFISVELWSLSKIKRDKNKNGGDK